MDRGINSDSWDGILSTRGSKLTLIAYVLSASHGARFFQNDYSHWGKSVFAKSQECSFQKMHNFLKQRLTNETPKVLLKSCLHLRRLGFPGTLLVGCVFLRGGEALGEEDWVQLRMSGWGTQEWLRAGGSAGAHLVLCSLRILLVHPASPRHISGHLWKIWFATHVW